MNTLIKPPCTNGETQSKCIDQHLVNMANINAHNEATSIIDDSNLRHTVLTDRHGESPCFVYDNAVKYARRQGYTVITNKDSVVEYPYAFKGYDYTTKKLNRQNFAYVYLGVEEENPEYATAGFIVEQFNSAQNYQQLIENNAVNLTEDINYSELLDDGTEITAEYARRLVTTYVQKLLNSLTKYDPYHVNELYYDLMIDYTSLYGDKNIWTVAGYTENDAANSFSSTIITNNITNKTMTGEELLDEIQWKFIGTSFSNCLDMTEAIIKHLITNPNCPESLVGLMHDFKN